MTKKYLVISPDGFPITCEPFESEQAARDAIPVWCKRFEHQGYYASLRGRISLAELPECLRIVEA